MTDIEMLDPAEAELDAAIAQPIEIDPAQPMRLYLVDGSGYIFRAFHALPPLTRKSDGVPVGAVAGFCNMIWKLLVDMNLSRDWVPLLGSHGWEAKHWSNVGPGNAPDTELMPLGKGAWICGADSGLGFFAVALHDERRWPQRGAAANGQ